MNLEGVQLTAMRDSAVCGPSSLLYAAPHRSVAVLIAEGTQMEAVSNSTAFPMWLSFVFGSRPPP